MAIRAGPTYTQVCPYMHASLCATHEFLGAIDHFLLLLWIILILLDKAFLWDVHSLLDSRPLLNTTALHKQELHELVCVATNLN